MCVFLLSRAFIFQHEIVMHQQLRHKNILESYCAFVHGNEIWLTLPLMGYGESSSKTSTLHMGNLIKSPSKSQTPFSLNAGSNNTCRWCRLLDSHT